MADDIQKVMADDELQVLPRSKRATIFDGDQLWSWKEPVLGVHLQQCVASGQPCWSWCSALR